MAGVYRSEGRTRHRRAALSGCHGRAVTLPPFFGGLLRLFRDPDSPESAHGTPGRAPFTGVTTSSVIASILESEPAPMTEERPEVPAELERIVRRAICKNREERYANASELVSDLKAFKEAPAAQDGAKPRYAASSWKRRSVSWRTRIPTRRRLTS